MSARTRMSMSMSMPCAACKFLRRRCTTNCIFLPYFPASESEKFAAVHQVFGASNFSKLLRRIPDEYREDAVQSLVYEARARLRDPIYGSVGLIASLQRQVLQLNAQLDAAIAEATLLNVQLTQTINSQPIIDYPLQLHTDSDTNFSGYDIGLHQL